MCCCFALKTESNARLRHQSWRKFGISLLFSSSALVCALEGDGVCTLTLADPDSNSQPGLELVAAWQL